MPKLSRTHRASIARGFTLIEALVVVAIVGVLAAVAYPSYTEQVRKSRRADAQAVLMQAAEFMERFHTENMRYDQSSAGLTSALPAALGTAPLDSATKFYRITLDSVTSQTYLLIATPLAAQLADTCGNLGLDNTGRKQASLSTCWAR
jgi:type IV pilus assembly protein PilE